MHGVRNSRSSSRFSMNKFVPAIGHSDFLILREANLGYIDKSNFIREVLADPALVLLFPRPRRFGKTLALSMLNYFFRKSNRDLSQSVDMLVLNLELSPSPKRHMAFSIPN